VHQGTLYADRDPQRRQHGDRQRALLLRCGQGLVDGSGRLRGARAGAAGRYTYLMSTCSNLFNATNKTLTCSSTDT